MYIIRLFTKYSPAVVPLGEASGSAMTMSSRTAGVWSARPGVLMPMPAFLLFHWAIRLSLV